MIRSLFVSLFFFLGPALLLFMLRNVIRLLVLRANNKHQEPEVIDVTPVKEEDTPRWFYALVIVISLACAVTVFVNLEKDNVEIQGYVPAHVDSSGNIVSGDWKSK